MTSHYRDNQPREDFRRRRRSTITWRRRVGGLFCADFREPRDYWAFLAADLAAALVEPEVPHAG